MSFLKTTAIQHLNGASPNINLDSTGKVGIGTSSPGYLLDIDQATNDAQNFRLKNEEVALFLGTYGTGSSYPREVTINGSRADSGSLPNLRIAGQGGIKFCVDFNTERMLINSSGQVTMPYQPFVAASKSTGSGWANWYNGGNGATFIFNSVYTNNGNHYNSTTGIFTCPVAGYYKVNASILMGNNTSTAGYFYLYKNGSSVQSAAYFYGGSGAASGNGVMEWIVYCAANDQLKIQVAGGNAAVIYESGYNSLTIALIG